MIFKVLNPAPGGEGRNRDNRILKIDETDASVLDSMVASYLTNLVNKRSVIGTGIFGWLA